MAIKMNKDFAITMIDDFLESGQSNGYEKEAWSCLKPFVNTYDNSNYLKCLHDLQDNLIGNQGEWNLVEMATILKKHFNQI